MQVRRAYRGPPSVASVTEDEGLDLVMSRG
jgi:hypothetical protein